MSPIDHRNILAYLSHRPLERTLPLQSGRTIAFADYLAVMHDDQSGETLGYQDEVVYVATRIHSDGSSEVTYLGMDWHHINHAAVLDAIIPEDAHLAAVTGAAERALRSMIPKR